MPRTLPVTPIIVGPSQLQEPYKKANNSYDPAAIGRFGFKTPGDMRSFLRSDSGKIALSIILEQAMQQKQDEQREQLALQEQLRRRQQLLALLLGAFLHKKAAASELRQAISEQIKHLKELTNKPKANTSASKEYYSAMENSYRSSLDALQSVIDEKTQAAEQLDKDIEQLLQEQESLESKHQIFDDSLSDITSLDQPALEQLIDESSTVLDDYMTNIQTLLEEDKVSEAQELLQKHNAHVAKRAAAEDMLALKKMKPLTAQASGLSSDDITASIQTNDRPQYYDQEGQATQDPLQIAYIVPQHLQLELRQQTQMNAKGENVQTLYLVPSGRLGPGESIDNLSPEEKSTAQKTFDRHQPQITSVLKTVQDIKAKERAAFEARSKPVLQADQKQQAELAELQNQKRGLESELAQLENLMQPRPKPSPSKTAETTNSYRQVLHSLKVMRLKAPEKEEVQQLKKEIQGMCPETEKRNIPKLKAGQVISKEQMQRILSLLGSSSGTLTEINQPRFSSTAPSPFSTVPKPGK
ncbi:MAG: hypothetical protein JJT82_08805 [Legionellaceae bacterium]|nr:hypothetical protein [Legionellaceae bacterium]